METDHGDYILSPAYDLLCTALHIDDSTLALTEGLYEKDYEEATYRKYGFYTRTSFLVFAGKAGIKQLVAEKAIDEMIQKVPEAIPLVNRSFLSKGSKKKYCQILEARTVNLLTN